MKNQTTTTTQAFCITAEATEQQLYTAAEIAVSIALRTLYSKSGLKLYSDLINAYHNDRKARAAAEITARATTAAAERDHARSMARAAAAIARRLTIDEDERTAAQEDAEAWTAEADHHAAEAADISRAAEGVTLSDRADMTQAAALAIIETWTTPAEVTETRRTSYAAAIGKEPDELTEEEEADLQTAANFRQAINAARNESRNLAHPDAMNGTSTKSRAATAEDVQTWIDTMGGTGADIRRPAYRKNTKATDCYDTMEHKDTKTQKGWYIIRHYKTVQQYTSFEMAQEQSGNEPTADNITEQEHAAALDRLTAIVHRANLTHTERAALAYYCIETAEAPTAADRATAAAVTQAAEAARREYLASRAEAIAKKPEHRQAEAIKAAQHTAANKATAARWQAALTAAGVKSERSRQRAQAAIIAALQGAAEKPSGIYYTESAPHSRIDLIAAMMDTAAQTTRAAAAVVWHEFRILYAAAPCVTGWTERAAKSAKESAEAIRAAKRMSRIDNGTEAAQAAAETAAIRYQLRHIAANPTAVAAMSDEEVQATARAYSRHKRRHSRQSAAKAKRKAAAIAAKVDTLSTTWAMWQAWTPEQQAAHMAYLHSLTR